MNKDKNTENETTGQQKTGISLQGRPAKVRPTYNFDGNI